MLLRLMPSKKEILFLRYKLQKGMLTKDKEPKEEDMGQMSGFISKLEGYPDLECSMIRATKIHKVLKHILKLPEIPKDGEFQIRNRSKALLEVWGKVLESAEKPTISLPVRQSSVQQSSETISALPVEVIDDWVLVIHAEEGNVIMEEGSVKFRT